MDSVLQDIRYAIRGLRKSPGLALLAVLCMGLGIGTVTTMFSTAEAFTFRPMPQVHDAGRVTHVWEAPAGFPNNSTNLSPAALKDAQALSVFDGVLGARWWTANITGADMPEQVRGGRMTVNALHVLERKPLLGRDFTEAEGEPGADHVVLLGYGLWQRRFGGDSAIVGRAVWVNGEAYRVVGVMPEDFAFPVGVQIWRPVALSADEWADRRHRNLLALARRAPGVSEGQVEAAVTALGQRLAAAYPAEGAGWVMHAEPAERFFGAGPRPFMMVLLASGAFVLLIACANVANLLLARATGRRRELAVRIALGASRGRIVREQLVESLLIAVAGGVLGVLYTLWGLNSLGGSVPIEVRAFIPGFGALHLDPRALVVTAGVALLSGVLFGLAPAFAAARVDVQGSLKEGARGDVGGGRSGRLRGALVVAEVALALLLLIGATQTLDTFRRLALTDPGFRSQGVLTLAVSLPEADYPKDSAVVQFYRDLQDRIAALPGVGRVGSTTILPLSWSENRGGVEVEGRPLRRREDAPVVGLRNVSPGYLEALGVPLARGRTLNEADRMGSLPVAVVSEAAARLLWPGEDAIGKRFRPDTVQWVQVVGVVRNVRANPLMGGNTDAVAYFSNLQRPWRSLTFVVVTAGDPAALAQPVQRAINSLDSRLAAGDVTPMPRVIMSALSPQSATAQTMAASALIALIMACVGIYGVMSYAVSQRTQEIGVRVALGATSAGVLRLVFGSALRLAAIGIVIGLAGAVAMGRGLQAILVGTKATDPVALSAVALGLALVTVGASWLPARRATRVDPMTALRSE
jgi:putative ABC transport system permease protein